MTRIVFFALLIFVSACSLKKDTNSYSDPYLIRIAEFQDRRQADSLYRFLQSDNPIYRKAAALAFASVQDTISATALGNTLLEDSIPDVRQAAAFALGQTGGFLSVNSLIPACSDKNVHVVCEVLEALGKTVSKKDIGFLIEFKAKDSLTQAGLARGFYRLGIRGMADSLVIDKAKEFLNSRYSNETRLATAHFFSRSSGLHSLSYAKELINSATEDPNVFVRMAAASGLRRVNSKESLEALKKIISSDKDYRVRSNAVRALSGFSFEESRETLLIAIQDKNINVGITASETIRSKATLHDQQKITEAARSSLNWRVQANLYETALSLGAAKELVAEVESVYTHSKNNYQKSWLLNALSKAPATFPLIRDELLHSKVLVIKSAAAQALVRINRQKDFLPSLKPDFATVYRQAIADGDAGVIASVASALSDSVLDYRSIIKDFNFLYEAKEKLKLPKDLETLQPLEEAIAWFEGRKKPMPPKNEFNHPIDWARVKEIAKNQMVRLTTSKGEILLQFFVEEAPGSVANFISLCEQKYFDGKFFHRVVPNFVAQAGCNRGDGFGSEAYSIRSEFSARRYTEGSVGMASAGKDTEGTQWFITHSPTPHLDGRYSIFAEVIEGMDVVHQLEVGDQIVTAILVGK